MAKTLVNIITEDNPIPAYLFIKEKYETGDRLMYISAKDTEDDLDALSELFSVPATMIEEIILKNNNDELAFEKICRTVYEHLNHETHYCVNLAGGTRYMALAVQQVFEKFNVEYFYVQVEENQIVKSIFHDSFYDNDDTFFPIQHRMTIAEYLRAHEITHDLTYDHKPIRSEEYTEGLFGLFINNELTTEDYDTIRILREHYRKENRINIDQVESAGNYPAPQVPELTAFLDGIDFTPAQRGFLNQEELEYITGGWFEEYVYHLVKKEINPQDIALNVTISRKGITHKNELDVVFTKGNKLFVIECKTGVQSDHLFNEIVYKLCAISEAMLGVSCCSYIISLKQDNTGMLKRIADNMGLTFLDRTTLASPRELRLAMTRMDILAHDTQQPTSSGGI